MIRIKCSVKKDTFFKMFWCLFLLEGICTMTVYFLSAVSISFAPYASLYKIPLILQFCLAVVYLFFSQGKVYLNRFSILFLSFLPIGMVVGIAKGQFNTKYISHIYFYIMPIVMMSFGYALYKEYKINAEFHTFVKKTIMIGAIVSSIYVLIFTVCAQMGILRQNNFGQAMSSYAMPFYICENGIKILIGYFLIVINIMTKKRAILVATIALLGIVYLIGRKTNKNIAIHLFMFIMMIIICVFFAYNTTFFSRIIMTVKGFVEGDLYVATGGRDMELEYILEYLNTDKIMWLLGIGFGGNVWVGNIYRHYSHFSPLAYVMTGGIFFSVMLYAGLIWYVVMEISKGMKGELRQLDMPFVLLLVYFFITSLSGSSMLSVPLCWAIIGMNSAIIKDKIYVLGIQN